MIYDNLLRTLQAKRVRQLQALQATDDHIAAIEKLQSQDAALNAPVPPVVLPPGKNKG